MFRMTCGVVAAFMLVASAVVAASAQSAIVADRSLPRIAAATALLDRYRSSHALDDLRAAESDLFSANDFSSIRPDELVTRRRAVTSGYARVLHELEALIDPTFDPNDRNNYPSTCVTPPREPGGHQYGSCTDPKVVQDPATRAAYVSAIEANAAKIRRMNTQSRVHTLANEVTDSLRRVLREYRTRAPADTTALDTILRQAGISEARRTVIHATLENG